MQGEENSRDDTEGEKNDSTNCLPYPASGGLHRDGCHCCLINSPCSGFQIYCRFVFHHAVSSLRCVPFGVSFWTEVFCSPFRLNVIYILKIGETPVMSVCNQLEEQRLVWKGKEHPQLSNTNFPPTHLHILTSRQRSHIHTLTPSHSSSSITHPLYTCLH